MISHRCFVRLLLAALAVLFAATPRAEAGLSFNLVADSGTSQQAIDGFTAAGALWSNLFEDDITINLQIGFRTLGGGVLAQASSTDFNASFTGVRNALIGDRISADDFTAAANLPGGVGVGMLINRTSDNPNGSGSAVPFLDNNNSANNTNINMTSANAKALGLLAGNSAAIDASITFNSSFSFDFDRSGNSIAPGAFDFVGIAAHEIGHALGFISGVDVLDFNGSSSTGGPFPSNAFTFVTTLDLFRYSAQSRALGAGVIDWTADNRRKYFSIDGGTTEAGATFSTGSNFGDGRQASHWKDSLGLGIMDPTAGPGEFLSISSNDIRAFDVIGYNVRSVTVVPEPSSMAMVGIAAGIFAGGSWIRRRRATAA